MSEYEITFDKEDHPGMKASLRLRWNEPEFPGKWSVCYADINSNWSELKPLTSESQDLIWPYEALIWDFFLDEVKDVCPPSVVLNRSPEELECISDISGICRGMTADLERCFTEDEKGKAAWIGGSLLLFSYIETLGRLFMPKKEIDNQKAMEAFIRVYMPNLARSIESTYREALHQLDRSNAFVRFYDCFRNGLSHQYFPKRGQIVIDRIDDNRDELIMREEYAGGHVVIIINGVLDEFRTAVGEFLEDVIDKRHRVYKGNEIDVCNSCMQRLNWWLFQESERLIKIVRTAFY